MEQVEKPDVDRPGLPCPVVPEDVVDLLERGGEEASRLTVLDGRGFTGVSVVEREASVGRKKAGQ
jgi:hypothetical protein